MILRTLVLAASALALTACAQVQRLPFIPGGDAPEVETIPTGVLGWRIVSDDILAVRVASNGCTRKADFRATVRQRDGRVEVSLERIREDMCRAYLPEGVEIAWGFEELGARRGAQVVVVNPAQ